MKIAPLDLQNFVEEQLKGSLVIDIRPYAEIIQGIIPGSFPIPDGNILNWMNLILNEHSSYLVVTSKDSYNSANSLKLKNIKGYLTGGIRAWQLSDQKMDQIISVDGEEIQIEIKLGEPKIIDIRMEAFYDENHVKDADNISIEDLFYNVENLPNDAIYYLYDSNGADALSIAGFIKMNKLHNYYIIEGGYEEMVKLGVETEAKV